jgi:hypothetical protein
MINAVSKQAAYNFILWSELTSQISLKLGFGQEVDGKIKKGSRRLEAAI